MLLFKRLEVKNLATIGDEFITVDLNRHKTTVVYGENGTSKSSLMLESLCFCLYNKPYKKIKLGELVNNKNVKGLEVRLTFNKNNDKYIIHRGYKPQFLTITRNGEVLPQTMTQQAFIEEELLEVPYSTFKQIIAMGKADYTSFISLPLDKRRQFVESILNTSVYRAMLEKHKENQKALQAKISDEEHEIRLQEKLLSQHFETVKTLKKNLDEANKEEISSKKAEQDELKQALEKLNTSFNKEEYDGKKQEAKEVKAGISKIETFKFSLAQKLKDQQQFLSFIQTTETCPTCKQAITEAHKQSIKEEQEGIIQELKDKEDKLNSKCEDLISHQEEIDNKINNLDAILFNIRDNETKLSNVIRDLDRLTKQTNNKQEDKTVNELKEKMKEVKSSLEAHKTSLSLLQEQQEVYKETLWLLSDGGIKAIVIKKYLPVINSLINEYVSQLGLFATVSFDEDFKETIKKRGFDNFSFYQLSEGEKLRVDLSIMLAWREVAAMKAGLKTNLLIMDEIFNTSMDYQGCKAFIDILNSKDNQNTFIISPNAEDILDLCHSSIHLKKIKGFTEIVNNW